MNIRDWVRHWLEQDAVQPPSARSNHCHHFFSSDAGSDEPCHFYVSKARSTPATTSGAPADNTAGTPRQTGQGAPALPAGFESGQ